jgi:anti-sigma regulatory factor (Ser/Thr protein kinase)
VIDRPHLLSLTLAVDASAPEVVRAAISSLGMLSPDLRDDLLLVAAELVSNVVTHAGLSAGDSLDIAIEDRELCVRLEVGDGGQGFSIDLVTKARREPDARTLGLFIVEQLSDQWGVLRDGRFVVWAEFSKV